MSQKHTSIPKAPKELLAAFGGRIAVSEITGASRNSVSNWYRDGIPHRLVKAAREKKVEGITHDSLEAANKLLNEQNEANKRTAEPCIAVAADCLSAH